jgi:Phosphoenolpyruvate carboxykinase
MIMFNLEQHQGTVGELHHNVPAGSLITENTRAYPIEFISSAKIPCIAGHPSDVIFLPCDLFRENFTKYEASVGAKVTSAGPA